MTQKDQTNLPKLIRGGMCREKDLLPYLPFSKTQLWRSAKQGEFPQPIKISKAVTAWRNDEVLEWLKDPIAWKQKQQAELSDSQSATGTA